jgi:LmbE family N-acetylglucosaminyl deacetylase
MAAAAEVLGLAGHHALGYPDGELENTVGLRGQLVALIRSIRPDMVVCPDPTAVFFGPSYFNHHDHRAIGWAALDAVSPAAAQPHYYPETGAPHAVATVFLSGTLEPDVWVDISDTVDRKAEALLRHESQVAETAEWLRTFVRERAEDGGRAAGVGCAEGFRRFTPAG